MIVTVQGCKDQAFESELIKASQFYGRFLLSKQMLPHIAVNIVMKSAIKDLGNCTVAFYNDWYKPREFEVQLRKRRSLKSTLQTLAHEFVHVKQFARGELNCGHTKWLGDRIDSDSIDYNDLPWEIEATSLEVILYEMYKQNK